MLNVIAALLLTVAPGDAPTVNVTDDIVTINADFITAYNLPSTAITVVDGVPMAGTNQLLASKDGVSPIVITLPPGTYDIVAFGYPVDRLNPQRIKLTLSVTIENPDRLELIRDAFVAYAIHSYATSEALSQITTLQPTPAEIAAVFSGPINHTNP